MLQTHNTTQKMKKKTDNIQAHVLLLNLYQYL